jgi:hypothetical protein
MSTELLQTLPAAAVFILLFVQGIAPVITRWLDRMRGKEPPPGPPDHQAIAASLDALLVRIVAMETELHELHEVHLGTYARDTQGVPRWYLPSELVPILKQLGEVLGEVKALLKAQTAV